jgi:DNA-binding CsgD family transcriptional regulator
MAISPKTVETYRNRITLKVGVETLADLVKFAIRAGIVSTE